MKTFCLFSALFILVILIPSHLFSKKDNLSKLSGNVLTVSGFIGDCEMKYEGGEWQGLYIGDKVPENSEVRVNGQNDYLELDFPDGSTLKISGLTSVRISDILNKKNNGKQESFISLLTGKLFASVKPSSDQDFKVETQTAIAAVRGTKFTVSFSPSEGGQVFVGEGAVALKDIEGKFNEVVVKEGFVSEIPAEVGEPPSAPKEASKEVVNDYQTELSNIQQEKMETTVPVQETTPVKTEEKAQKPGRGCSEQGLNWSVSAETLDNSVWNKVLLSPTFKFGDFSFGLYLALYFKNLEDLGYIDRWYNKDEWDFSSWQDALHDLLLKIRFAQYQNGFMLAAIGSLDSMTIGHGSLVDGYANDIEFPAVRKVGFQFNIDADWVGFESMTGDAFLMQLFAGRLFARPFKAVPIIGKTAFGISGFIDTDPLLDGKRKVFGYGADIDYPLIDFDSFKTILYGDVATLGYHDEVIKDDDSQVGYGIFTGVKGSLAVLDYKAEYRYIAGGFMPSYIDKFYDMDKTENYYQLISHTLPDFNGFLLEAGKKFEGIGSITASYQHLFPMDSSTNIYNFLHLEASVSKCLFQKAYGTIAYDRKNFIFSDLYNSFVGNGVIVTTQIFYEITEGVYVGLLYKKYYETDAFGNLTEKFTVGLQTQMGL